MIFISTFIAIAAFISLMAIGIIMGRKPIKGSCGGQTGESGCEICGSNQTQCMSDNTSDKKHRKPI